ncbi:MAG: hypothetical protein ACHQNE_03935, partial [Candidatus Kapaibacterium sp.]
MDLIDRLLRIRRVVEDSEGINDIERIIGKRERFGIGGAELSWESLGAESLGIACKLGVDGLNVGLVLMGAVVAFAAACCSFEIKSREKEFYILLLVMTGGILGAFASLDLFFFYFLH